MITPISFSSPESGGTYFACIAYVEGVVFQLKFLRNVQFRATFFCVLCRVDSEGNGEFSHFLESVNKNLEVGDLARARISVLLCFSDL